VKVAKRSLLGLAFAGFVGLGLPKSGFGVAWPGVADDLGRPLAELGLVLAVHTAGYLASSALNGTLTHRFGIGRLLFGSSALAAVTLLGYTLTPWFVLLLGAAFMLGMGSGVVDAGINAYVAVHYGARVMNLLHASFGVGATMGPLLMTLFLTVGGSWRAAYLVLAILQAGLAVAFHRARRSWDGPRPAAIARAERPRPSSPALLWVGLAVFFLYTGIEVGVGQWAFSLLTESRGIGDTPAGLLVAAYWGAFTVGRFGLAVAGDRLPAERTARALMAATLGGLALLWWNPAGWAGAAALALLGLSLSGIFPALTLLTPRRLGAEYAPWAVGYQLAAASLGVGALPGAAGLAVAWLGLESLPALFFAAAVLMVALNEALTRMSRTRAAPPPSAPGSRRRLPGGR
jgi:fucose permease